MTRLFRYAYQLESCTDSLCRENAEAFPAALIKFDLCIQYSNNFLVPVGSLGSGPAAQLSAKAQHHSTSVCKVDGHLARQGDDTDSTETYVGVCSFTSINYDYTRMNTNESLFFSPPAGIKFLQ